MKRNTLLFIFFFLMYQASAQCERTAFFLSPSLCNYYNGNIGVGIEAGLVPAASPFIFSVKTNLWTESASIPVTQKNGQTTFSDESMNRTFIGVKLSYVPQAFEDKRTKWSFGTAAGLYAKEGSAGSGAVEISSAYIIRMTQGGYSNGSAYIKLEAACLMTPISIVPGLNIGIAVLM